MTYLKEKLFTVIFSYRKLIVNDFISEKLIDYYFSDRNDDYFL